MIVVDASVLATALLDDGDGGDRARDRLRGEVLVAPELVDLEVLAAIRRQAAARGADKRRTEVAQRELQDLPMHRVSHRLLLPRCWQLRDNLTTYDASYVALAEAFEVSLLTADRRLARAPGLRCAVEMLTA